MIDQGDVRINGSVVAKPSTVLSSGAQIEATLPVDSDGSVAPDPEVAIEVLLEDDGFLVLNKSFELVVHPGAGNRRGTLIAGVLAAYPEMAALPLRARCPRKLRSRGRLG